MSRFLFVVLPMTAHTNAAVAIGQVLIDSGHEVAWCGPETLLRPLVGPDATIFPTGMRFYRAQAEQGPGALKLLWEGYLIPLTRFTLRALDRAVTAYQPDVMIVDQYAFGGALVAHQRGLRWASLCVGVMELIPPFPDLEPWVHDQLARVWAMADLPPDDAVDLRFSPYLVIALTSSALTGTVPLPDSCVQVGPVLGRRVADPPFPWDWLDPGKRHILVTVGTLAVHMASDFYSRMMRALRPLADRVQAVVIGPDDALPDPPPYALVAARVPVLDLMPRLDAVVSHCGLGTLGEALFYGVPLVVAPIRHDQPTLASQVVAAGAGIEVSFTDASPEQLRSAVMAVLDDPAYRANARRVGDSFVAGGGARAAAAHLADLAVAPPRVSGGNGLRRADPVG